MKFLQSMNVSGNGMKSKLVRINGFLMSTIFDFFAIQETWLNATVSEDRCDSRDRRFRGGGVALLIRNSIDFWYIEFKACANAFWSSLVKVVG